MPRGFPKSQFPEKYGGVRGNTSKKAKTVIPPAAPVAVANKRKLSRLPQHEREILIKFIRDNHLVNQPVADILTKAKTDLNIPTLTLENVKGARFKVMSQPTTASLPLVKRVERLEKLMSRVCAALGEPENV